MVLLCANRSTTSHSVISSYLRMPVECLNLLYFRGQCEKSYLQSKGDMRHDTDRQRKSQEVQ